MTLIDLLLEERKILSDKILPESEKKEKWQKIVDKIQQLIKSSADVNIKVDGFGYTVLMLSYSAKTTQMLIDAGADVNTRDKNGETALMWASAKGDSERVKLLINAGADVNAIDNVCAHTALMTASTAEIVRLLIEAGADINLSAKSIWTALEQSVYCDQYEKTKILLAAGADVNAKNIQDGKTVLMGASGMGQKEMVKLLIESGADVNAQDNEGHNAVWYAKNHTDKRVFHFGIEQPEEKVYAEIIEILKKAGAEEK